MSETAQNNGITRDQFRQMISTSKGTADVVVDGKKVMVVKAISPADRIECKEAAARDGNANDIDAAKFQIFVIIKGSVEPKLTMADADWLMEDSSIGFVDEAVKAIYKLSGISLLPDEKKKD